MGVWKKSERGHLARRVLPPHVTRLGERFHQTLFRWLDKQPLAKSIAELQEQVERFDVLYNTERPHQGLPGRITPRQSRDATPLAEPPPPEGR